MTDTDIHKIKIRTLYISLLISILLMGFKFTAYFITQSIAILSDALESIVNVVAGIFAIYSIWFAIQPKDKDHPYGHGKMENISAGFEGALVFVAGITIIAEGVYGFFYPHELKKVDIGLFISGFAGGINFFVGTFLVNRGKKYNSLTLIADGKHLIADTVSSIGLVVGLTLIYFTQVYWLDNAMAIIFGTVILYTGFKLVRESVTNLLDKADIAILNKLIFILNSNRRDKWIDMHNLRVLKYGTQLHVDVHLTLPWYDPLEGSHKEVSAVEKVVKENMGDEMEFFIHADPCLPTSCPVCMVKNCPHRQSVFVKKIEWTVENLLPDIKHKID